MSNACDIIFIPLLCLLQTCYYQLGSIKKQLLLCEKKTIHPRLIQGTGVFLERETEHSADRMPVHLCTNTYTD